MAAIHYTDRDTAVVAGSAPTSPRRPSTSTSGTELVADPVEASP